MNEDNFFCSYCDAGFEEYEELEAHMKICDKKPKATVKIVVDEHGRKKELPIVVYKQDPNTVDKKILYSNSDVTVRHLVQTLGYPLASDPGAYRKEYDHCPHCKYKMDEDKWAKPPNLIEVCLAEDKYSWDNSQIEEMITFISECPKCGVKSIRHYSQYQIFSYDWIDHRKIIDTLVKRGVIVEDKKSHNLVKCKHCGKEMEKADLCEGCGCCVNLGTVWDDWGCCSCEWDEVFPMYARNRGKK